MGIGVLAHVVAGKSEGRNQHYATKNKRRIFLNNSTALIHLRINGEIGHGPMSWAFFLQIP